MNKPCIIAELSANHNQQLDIALRSVEAIAKSGADAIKVQTYKPSCLTLPYKNEYFRIKDGLWKNQYLWDLYTQAQMPWEWHKEIFALAQSLGLLAFSSPFSKEGVEFLETLQCPIYKVASFEIAHIPLLQAIAETKKPVILSLGIANDKEIESALKILKNNRSCTLLYCISAYPANISDAKLSHIQILKKQWEKYNVDVGISDHTLGITVPIVATLCGASAIEKHFILDKSLDTADSKFSLDSLEFTQLVNAIQETCILAKDLQSCLANVSGGIDVSQHNLIDNHAKKGREFARSLFICKDVKKREIISLENIACVRPSFGLSPLLLDSILGLEFSMDLQAGIPLESQHIKHFNAMQQNT